MLQNVKEETEFIQTAGSNFAPESVKQGAIIKIVGNHLEVTHIIFESEDEKRVQTLGRMKPRA